MTQHLLSSSHAIWAVASPYILEATGSWDVGEGYGLGWAALPFWPLPSPIPTHRRRGPCHSFYMPPLPRTVEAQKGNVLTESPAAPAAMPEPASLTSCPVQLSGLALFAETVWVTADQYRVYPLMGVSGKDDVFAGAWIAIFCGFSFFVVASFGVGAALCRRRSMILTVRPQGEGEGTGGHGDHQHRLIVTTTAAAMSVCSARCHTWACHPV